MATVNFDGNSYTGVSRVMFDGDDNIFYSTYVSESQAPLPEEIASGKKAWVNGELITGTRSATAGEAHTVRQLVVKENGIYLPDGTDVWNKVTVAIPTAEQAKWEDGAWLSITGEYAHLWLRDAKVPDTANIKLQSRASNSVTWYDATSVTPDFDYQYNAWHAGFKWAENTYYRLTSSSAGFEVKAKITDFTDGKWYAGNRNDSNQNLWNVNQYNENRSISDDSPANPVDGIYAGEFTVDAKATNDGYVEFDAPSQMRAFAVFDVNDSFNEPVTLAQNHPYCIYSVSAVMDNGYDGTRLRGQLNDWHISSVGNWTTGSTMVLVDARDSDYFYSSGQSAAVAVSVKNQKVRFKCAGNYSFAPGRTYRYFIIP